MESESTAQAHRTVQHLERTLRECFQRVFRVMTSDAQLCDLSGKTSALERLLEDIAFCEERVDVEGLLSKNEELDDVQTSSLPYLFLPYYRAKALLSFQDMALRRAKLLQGRAALQHFLERCAELKLLHESEAKKLDREREQRKPMSGDEKRMFKIEKFKRERAAKQRMQELQRVIGSAESDSDAAIDREEEQRELSVLLMQSYARDALDELDVLEEELVMLAMREDEEELAEFSPSAQNASASSNAYIPYKAMDPNRPGIQITRTSKAGDQLIMSRETIKTTVFGSNIAPPTMSLVEFGDLQRQEALERQEVEANAPKGPRKYRELLADGEEDNDELLDIATTEDRKWDAWKEDNPRGWGNKMGKRF